MQQKLLDESTAGEMRLELSNTEEKWVMGSSRFGLAARGIWILGVVAVGWVVYGIYTYSRRDTVVLSLLENREYGNARRLDHQHR